jgi:hypothetical protein
MIVYRFERNGLGPYISRGWVKSSKKHAKSVKKHKALLKEMNNINRPSYNDNWLKAHRRKDYIFGCSSKLQLRAYFNNDFKHLFKAGYRIKRYPVPDEEVIDMYKEVAFPVKYHKMQSIGGINRRLKKCS